ncbi:LLM class F420-dependent oxidoreductase [Mycobacterium vicinigordonae]|uniref:LLM class F420-dependent oxidoreductase n=1 Tax=Mycobacterium vicinigordonae TaxID=1719132 RepID=A0A7D6DY80_9MYCO|nr:LLM class F420-dependent oxidoreductase [Mycobacterium vicinigordonae]QLL07388.1 LLM class F420-dependent oxidoreductase [Mycobacterium vicinigordonae]
MQLGTTVSYAGNVRETIERVRTFEKAGLDVAWVAEAYGYDAVTMMGYLAARTERVQIGSGILPLYSRSPALLAQTAAGLDHLSDGRALLGLGASGPQVVEGWHGAVYDRPLERTREIIEICRRVWRREVLRNEGIYPIPLPSGQGTGLGKPLKIINCPIRPSIPIFVAALGAKNVQLAAEVADGWLPTMFVPEYVDQIWGEALRRGLAARAEELSPLRIAAGGPLAIGEDVTDLRNRLRAELALYIGGMGARKRNFYFNIAAKLGHEGAAARIQDLYLAGLKDEAAAAVPAELLEGMSLIGPRGYVKERLAAYRQAGVTILNVHPIGPDPVGDLERLRSWL